MPSFAFDVPHQLEPAEAVRRLRARAELIKNIYHEKVTDLEEQWADDGLACSFRTMGQKFQGTMKAVPGSLQIKMTLPILAMMFRGTIESKVREELGKLLT